MQYIAALGFRQDKEYTPADLEDYNGHRIFRSPSYESVITVEDGNLFIYGDNDDESNNLEIQIATILLGEHVCYLTPLLEYQPAVQVWNKSRKITIIMEEEYKDAVFKIETRIKIRETGEPIYKRNDGRIDATPETIIGTLKKLYPDFFKSRKLRMLQRKCAELARENAILKEQIKFMPGGPGFDSAKEHFTELAEGQEAK